MAPTLSDARTWTPECAVRDGRLATRVSEIAEAWVRDWFADASRTAIATDFGLALRRSGETDRCWSADGLMVAVSRRALVVMGAAMAGYTAPAARAEDEAMLERVAQAGVGELWSHLAALFGADHNQPRAIGGNLDKAARLVCRFGDCMFEVFVAPDRLAVARKALAAPRKRSSPPQTRAEALARQHLDVSVLVGGARLGLREMKALAIGDVIVLDRRTNDDLDLMVARSQAAGINCRFDRDGERIAIRITQPSPSPSPD